MQIVKPSVGVEWVTPHALKMIERAGRTCYRSEPKGEAEKFIRKIIQRGHESVLEHAFVSFRVVCDRGIMAEARTHRIASFSVESTRWCNYAKEMYGGQILVIEPPGMSPESRKVWLRNASASEVDYMEMLALGNAPQIARSVLSFSLASEFVVTTNFREWRHIMGLRLSPEAHPQMREIMRFIYDFFKTNFPVIVEDINLEFPKKEPKVLEKAPGKGFFSAVCGGIKDWFRSLFYSGVNQYVRWFHRGETFNDKNNGVRIQEEGQPGEVPVAEPIRVEGAPVGAPPSGGGDADSKTAGASLHDHP